MTIQKLFTPAPRQKKILGLLTTMAPKRLSIKDLSTTMDRSYQVIARDMRELLAFGLVKRTMSGEGNFYSYTIDVKNSVNSGNPVATELPNVESKVMLGWLQRFAESDQYLTKVQEFGWMFPNMLARVYQLACRDAAGEPATKYELDLIKADFAQFVKTCELYISIMRALLVQDELWDPAQLQPYLCGDAPVEIVQSFTDKLLDNWGQAR